MSRKQLILIVVLAAICAWVNRGLFMRDNLPEERPMASRDIVDSEPSSDQLEDLSRHEGPQEPLGESPEIQTPQSKTSREQVLLTQLATRLLERREGRVPRVASNPFAHVDSGSGATKASAKDRERLKAEEDARREAESLKAAEMRRRAELIESIRKTPVHAIIASKVTAVARIGGRNLRVDDCLPGTEARITAIRPREVEVMLGKDRIIIPLTPGKKVRRRAATTEDEGQRSAQVTPPPALLPGFGGKSASPSTPPAGGNS